MKRRLPRKRLKQMKESEKISIVAKFLNSKKDDGYTYCNEIIAASEQKITENDLTRILPLLQQVGSIEREYAGEIEDAFNVPNLSPKLILVIGYRLTSLGKLRMEGVLEAPTGNPAPLQNDKKTEIGQSKIKQLTIREIALRQFFIYKYEKGKEIVKGNAKEFFEGTTHETTGRLIKWFNEYKKDTNRLGFNSNSGRTDTKQLNGQIGRYKNILPTLINFSTAYSKAKKELEELEAK